MPGKMFDDRGRLKIPEMNHERTEGKEIEVVLNAVYCPEGHNLISLDHLVSGYPAIVVKFSGRKSGDGLLALSAILGNSAYDVLEGEANPDEMLDLSCPHCGTPLDVLGSCPCNTDAVTVMAYLYPVKDPRQAIAFCNVLSCPNSALFRSGEIIRLEQGRT